MIKMEWNFSLLDKERFKGWEEQRIKYLQALKIEQSIRIMECLLSSEIDKEFRRIKKELEKNGL
ncbi:hypothetical protein LR007_03830 [candidate division NPL-UPA2 bacterium]|nr:hypothetical protein [candidate division NPL-UPA2 bacterium]